jgi:chemotaxis protein methyltransferase CheR
MYQISDLIQSEDATDVLQLSPKGFGRLAHYITGELGIKMPDSKMSMIQSRLVRRVRELGLSSIEHYGEYLFASGNSEEREHFINAVTTNKTDFFREPEHFRYLTDIALPSIRGAAKSEVSLIRVWSAACSSGEEPYTLAMVLSEFAQQQQVGFAILATDVSTKVLQMARRGVYAEAQIAPVSLEMRKKYLLYNNKKSERLVRIVPKLRQSVSFHQLNFMLPDYRVKDRFDIIFLRNVLIYFDKNVQEAVVNKVCRYLNPGGYLFVSHSESLSGLKVPVNRVGTSIYRLPIQDNQDGEV